MDCRLMPKIIRISASAASVCQYGPPAQASAASSANAAAKSIVPTAPRRRPRNFCAASRAPPPCSSAAVFIPRSPCGRNTSTTAIVRNTITKVACGKTAVPKAWTRPIRSAATKAPPMLPSPPVTTTTKVSTITLRSICRCAGSRGSCSAPPRPASAQPSTTAPSINGRGLTPSAASISRSCVAARSRWPNSVWRSSARSPSQTSGPSAIITSG